MKAISSILVLSGVLLVCAAYAIGDDELAVNASTVNFSRSPRLRLFKYKPANKDDDLDRHQVFDLDQNDLDPTNLDDNDPTEEETPSTNYTATNDTAKVSKDQLLPIVLIPGLEGSRLTATLDKPTSSHYYCKKKAKTPFTIWINLEEFVIPAVNCFIENMRLNYDNETRRTSSPPGVNVQVPGFGSTDSIESLIGNRLVPQYYYFKYLVDSFTELGYERDTSIRGAPFDFRLAPNEQEEFFVNLKQLIETTYLENGKKKVILISHSMGSLYAMNLLNTKVDEAWKKRYISTWFAISSPWTGSIRAVKTMVTGDNMGIFLFNDKRFKDMERTFPGIAFLLPNPTKFGNPKIPSYDAPVVITPSRNYTLQEYDIMFDRMNQPDIYNMHLDTRDLVGGLKFPNVDMYCIYGTGVDTERAIIYDKDSNFPENPKKIVYDKNGDSSVNLESLEYCLKWKDQTKYKFKSLKVDDGDHLRLIKEDRVLDYLKAEIMKISSLAAN